VEETPEYLALVKQRDRANASAAEARRQKEKLDGELKKAKEELAWLLKAEAARRDEVEKKLSHALAELKAETGRREEAEKKLAVARLLKADPVPERAPERAPERGPARDAEDTIKLDNPNGPYVVRGLNRGHSVKLIGKVGTLRIGSINGGHLDASGLTAKTVIFDQAINNGSIIKVNAPDGTVKLAGINQGEVEIQAPGGRIGCTSDFNNSSVLKARAREVRLLGTFNGSVKAHVTLTAGGSLEFKLLQNASQLIWKKEKPTDAAPTITEGTVRAGATFKEE
jgi:hypothetical protein